MSASLQFSVAGSSKVLPTRLRVSFTALQHDIYKDGLQL
jgi:hypothetical protein